MGKMKSEMSEWKIKSSFAENGQLAVRNMSEKAQKFYYNSELSKIYSYTLDGKELYAYIIDGYGEEDVSLAEIEKVFEELYDEFEAGGAFD